MINSIGALGGFAGSYLVGLLQAVTHNQRAGFLLMAVALIVAGLLQAMLPRATPRAAEAKVIAVPEPDLA